MILFGSRYAETLKLVRYGGFRLDLRKYGYIWVGAARFGSVRT